MANSAFRTTEDELRARNAELEKEIESLKEYRDGHDPKVDFPPEGVWVNMRDCDDNFSPTQGEWLSVSAVYLPDHYLQLRQVLDVLEGGGE